MAAVLSADMQNTDKIVILVEECRRMGLEVLPPDVNVGYFAFTVNQQGQIVYGLGAIKGLGEGPVQNLVNVREGSGVFRDLFDFCKRVELGMMNKRAIEALIRSGACDHFGADRAVMLASMPEAVKTAEQNSRSAASGVGDLFGEVMPVESTGDVYANFHHIRPWSAQQRLHEEKETLGLYLSGHPISEFLPELAKITRNRLDSLKADRAPQLVAGLIHDIRMIKSKRGDPFAIITLDDRTDRIEATVYGDVLAQHRDLIRKDAIVVLEGVVSVDEYNGNGQLQMRVKRVISMQEARRQYSRGLDLTLHHKRLSVESLPSLRRLLAEYRAASEIEQPETRGCEIIVHLELDKVRGSISLGEAWRVLPDDALLQKLRENYGNDNVNLSYG
jgi:DNA polymerase-3 subunit alpha